jgi:hypothetical protein
MILITVRPGPVLHVWRDGAEVTAVPLSPSAALTIASDLLAAIVAQAGAPEGQQADLGLTLKRNTRPDCHLPRVQELDSTGF